VHQDGTAGQRRKRQERCGIGEVRLDVAVDRADRTGRHGPAVGVGVVHVDAVLAEHCDGHLQVRQRRDRLAVMAYVDPALEPWSGQEQSGDELRGS
jgi:hypothetical protein